MTEDGQRTLRRHVHGKTTKVQQRVADLQLNFIPSVVETLTNLE